MAFHLLFFLEHLMMLVPIITLRSSIKDWEEFLGTTFPPLQEESSSTSVVNWLLFSALAILPIQTVVSLILAKFYMQKQHAWTRLFVGDGKSPALEN